jgi:16S rRNA (cytosine967-C5)-methyltransferase
VAVSRGAPGTAGGAVGATGGATVGGADPHGLAPRRAAVGLLGAVLDEGRTLDAAKASAGFARLAPAEKARAGDLAAAALRWLIPVDALLAEFMKKPINPSAQVARDALRLLVAEVFALETPPHAAVDAAVRLTKGHRGSAPLSGLVNAVGRRAALAAPQRLGTAEAQLATPPGWLHARLRAAWGDAIANGIVAAHLRDAPFDATARDPAEAALWAERLGAKALPTGSLRRARAPALADAPGFAEGAWWPQDAAAALPARMLGDVAGLSVLDLCAAPGGKTLQLAAAGARVTAVDSSAERLERLRENLDRTGLNAEIVVADAREWAPPEPVDAVLLDAPCSATGTIRRHPDLPHLRRAKDIAPLIALQDALLDAAWGMLKPGGRLVFATCSLLREEGEDRAAAFLKRRADANREPLAPDELGERDFVTRAGDLRTRPDMWAGRGGVDGFFAARFRKAA